MRYQNMIKLPESELEVMQAIWKLYAEGEKEISAGMVMEKFPDLNRLKLTTVLTLITRLHSKGYIKSEKIGRSNCYTPLVAWKDYQKFALSDFAEKVYSMTKVEFIKKILRDGSFSKKEIEEIKEYLQK